MNQKSTLSKLGLLLLIILCQYQLQAQDQNKVDVAMKYIQSNLEKWGLQAEDVHDLAVSDHYLDRHTGKTRVYFQQQYQGIPIKNAIINIGINKEGEPSNVGHRFLGQLAERIQTTRPTITPSGALGAVLSDLNIAARSKSPAPIKVSEREFHFPKTGISKNNVKAKLMYVPVGQGQLALVWDMRIRPIGKYTQWNIQIDATSGEVIGKKDEVLHCSAHLGKLHSYDCPYTIHSPEALSFNQLGQQTIEGKTYQYNVYPFPIESPNHGSRSMVTNPADTISSPLGWHATSEEAEDQFTITRGNNIHAFQGRDLNSTSMEDEPDGGTTDTLVFDAHLLPDENPDTNTAAATINLFYAANFIHDFTYRYGFDEASGNFQDNNFGKGGNGNDKVYAIAQSGAQDDQRTNNAFFTPSIDGDTSFINMFVWSKTFLGSEYITVNSPDNIKERIEAGPTSDGNTTFGWGGDIRQNPVTGDLQLVKDDSGTPTDACSPLENSDELIDKIAVIDRGLCQFGIKALRAEQAGAIGVIICNIEEGFIGMLPGNDGDRVTIPVMMVQKGDCDLLKIAMEDATVNITMQTPQIPGPDYLDGDFDNGIIAHEYGHGVSGRLTGGPSQLCLGNAETGSEGWSDYFTLVTTVKDGDDGSMARGIGTYVNRQDINGGGIRPFPYSTDMNVSPYTYDHVNTLAVPHGVGAVWCAMLWDMYWALVEQHGWDADPAVTTAGNNIAIRLVLDGMKNQPCNPGFVDARDAILRADMDLTGGANQALIWKTFARRGLGFKAQQGNENDAKDGIEDFTIPPQYTNQLYVEKEVTPFIDAGDDIEVSLMVANYKSTPLTNIRISDELISGTSYINGSVNNNFVTSVSGDLLNIEIPDLSPGQVTTVTYKLATDPDKFSIRRFYDSVDDETADNWLAGPDPNLADNPDDTWRMTTEDSNSDEMSWFVPNNSMQSRHFLINNDPIAVSGTKPVLRFYHRYSIEPWYDGSLVQLETDADDIFDIGWDRTEEKILRNGYTGSIVYNTYSIPDAQAFWGDQSEWKATYIDLADYVDMDLSMRFSHATTTDGPGNATPLRPTDGWYVDDIEIMDMINYDGEVCVSAEEGDETCARAPEAGTIVESQEFMVPTEELFKGAFHFQVAPNPADDFLNVSISSEEAGNVQLRLLSLDGKVLREQSVLLDSSLQNVRMEIADLAAGMYFLHLSNEQEVVTEKVTIQ